MLDFTNCYIKSLIAHQVGNKTNGDGIVISESLLDTEDLKLRELLIKYFLYPFSEIEDYYGFTFSNDNFKLNPLYQFSNDIFSENTKVQELSKSIAKHLYEVSLHPQIKSGDLFVAIFSNVSIDDKLVDVIGIFKSENRQPFLNLHKNSKEFVLNYEDGINIEKLDKGCLIFNIEKDNGYKICVIDKSTKSSEAQYWKDFFLNIKPKKSEYHFTKDFLSITKNFVTNQLDEEFEISKTDKIELLNRSVEYFKTHETFDKQEFEEEVFQDDGIINSFRSFDNSYRQENEIEITDSFEISPQAVKKQARIFKSVLKLDKNFHIYIHGDSNLIEQGIEKDGRKFYKIYYDNES